ncbi:hypothetical protein [Parasphingorhabdus sp.]|uniref:Dyp-type peroxidase n=1 Tax=Parasphingorhabdus sp. TaxID=2709688 RepID=UPI0032994E10
MNLTKYQTDLRCEQAMDRIQDGVYFRSRQTPLPHFSILFLSVHAGVSSESVRYGMQEIWQMLQSLRKGVIADLPGQKTPTGDLSVLVGYGRSLFDSVVDANLKPSELVRFRKPSPGGGGAITLGSGISYSTDTTENIADADIALQFIGKTNLSVERAIVETWKTIEKLNSEPRGKLFDIRGSYGGFGRDDRRSWIDFFDGTANLRSNERLSAIEIKERGQNSPDQWKENGCYLCYIRLQVNLKAWQALSRNEQEMLVGRDKLTGCGLVAEDAAEGVRPVTGCPVTSGGNVEDRNNEAFRNAPRPAGTRTLRQAHIHRANQGRANTADPESRLVFRQGYEFFDGFFPDGSPRLGLNFVSFQDTPERILGMLKLRDWLGGVNFGGDETAQPPGMASLLTATAAGFFLAPPRDPFDELPGGQIFGDQVVG